MAQWYCHVDGVQYGPVSQDELIEWIQQNRVGPDDLVWTAGMENWSAAKAVFPEYFPSEGAIPPPLPVRQSMVSKAPPGGTGGQKPNHEITAQARAKLRGRWGLPIAFSLLLGLIMGAAQSIPQIGGLISMVVSGPFQLGGIIFYLTFVRGGECKLNMLFAGFKNFSNAVAAYLLMNLFIFLWSLLLIVPGIVAALAYSQTFYLMADDKSLGALEAIRLSKKMMQGHKWKLFCLGLRFLGWSLLCILTLGIGFLWLIPYMSASYAIFYDDLREPHQTEEVVPISEIIGK